MYAATLQSDASKIIVDGKGRVKFALTDGQTRLVDLYQRDPVRILFPETSKLEIPQAVVVTTSGGLVGGDRIAVEGEAGTGATALVTSQAAEKVYRSAGSDALIDVKLIAGPDSWLEYLPQETILFEGARLRRKTTLEINGDGRVFAGEIVVFGRVGSGESYSRGLIHDAWDVYIDGGLTWADALHLENDIADILNHEACFDGAVAMATAVYAGPDAESRLDFARQVLPETDDILSGATLVNGILVVRWLSRDAYELRNQFGEFWRQFRHHTAALPEKLPRLWHV